MLILCWCSVSRFRTMNHLLAHDSSFLTKRHFVDWTSCAVIYLVRCQCASRFHIVFHIPFVYVRQEMQYIYDNAILLSAIFTPNIVFSKRSINSKLWKCYATFNHIHVRKHATNLNSYVFCVIFTQNAVFSPHTVHYNSELCSRTLNNLGTSSTYFTSSILNQLGSHYILAFVSYSLSTNEYYNNCTNLCIMCSQ